MHPEAFAYVACAAGRRGPFARVVDIGGRDINGSPRCLFPDADYVSVDLYDGPGVDVVADALTWAPPGLVDAVLCVEVLEHAPEAERLIKAAASWLRPGGVLIVTAACDPRAPHSAADGGSLIPGEYYGNIDPQLLQSWLSDFHDVWIESHPDRGDVYAVGVRR